MFNTLKYVRILEEVGFSRDQAETSVRVLSEILMENIEDKFATKRDYKESENALRRDLKESENALRRDFKESENALRRDFKELQLATKHDLQNLESRLTIRLGGMLAAAVAILAAIQKLA